MSAIWNSYSKSLDGAEAPHHDRRPRLAGEVGQQPLERLDRDPRLGADRPCGAAPAAPPPGRAAAWPSWWRPRRRPGRPAPGSGGSGPRGPGWADRTSRGRSRCASWGVAEGDGGIAVAAGLVAARRVVGRCSTARMRANGRPAEERDQPLGSRRRRAGRRRRVEDAPGPARRSAARRPDAPWSGQPTPRSVDVARIEAESEAGLSSTKAAERRAARERLEAQRTAAREEIEHPRAGERRPECSSRPRAPGRRWAAPVRPRGIARRRPPNSPATIRHRVDGCRRAGRSVTGVGVSATSRACRAGPGRQFVALEAEGGVHRLVAQPGDPVGPLEADGGEPVLAVVAAAPLRCPDPTTLPAREASRRARRRPGRDCPCRRARGGGRAARAHR